MLKAAAELQSRLPRLIFAALDTFPLADGREGGLVAIAIRSVSASERLDSTVVSALQDLEQGSRQVQQKARQIRLRLSDEDSTLDLTVNYHELLDFRSLLQKGVPSAVETFRHTPDSAEVLHATDEWWELKASVAEALAPDDITATKPYMKACLGAANSLLPKGENDKRSNHAEKGSGYQPGNLTPVAMQTIPLLAKRASSDQDTAQINAMEQSGEWSVAAWKEMLQRLSAAASEAPLPKLKCLDLWCEKLRDSEYEAFKQSLQTVDVKCDALHEWQRRLAKAKEGSSLAEASTGTSLADQESAEAMKLVEGVIPAGSELVFLAQTGSFMYDLQVETSDMDFALIYQALPKSLLSFNPPRDEFSHHEHKAFASDKKGDVEYTGRELGFFIANLAKGNPTNVELLFSNKPAHRSWAWQELLEARHCFLTLRCAKQYMGFVSQRLMRAGDLLKAAVKSSGGETDVALSSGKEFSKLLYHAHHKMLDLGRILKGGYPLVALSGMERQQVLEIRLGRPKLKEAEVLLEQAEAQRAQLVSDLNAAEADGTLPAEVDAHALIQWLWSVRVRMARGVGETYGPGKLM